MRVLTFRNTDKSTGEQKELNQSLETEMYNFHWVTLNIKVTFLSLMFCATEAMNAYLYADSTFFLSPNMLTELMP